MAREESASPEGWLGPWISQSHVTPDLLSEAGYRYLLEPVWLTRQGVIARPVAGLPEGTLSG